MDPVTIFGAALFASIGLEAALREPAQLKRKQKLGLKGEVTLLDCVLAFTEEQAEQLASMGALDLLTTMMNNGKYIRGGKK